MTVDHHASDKFSAQSTEMTLSQQENVIIPPLYQISLIFHTCSATFLLYIICLHLQHVTFVLAAGRPSSNFRFLRIWACRPPVALRLCHLSREIPSNKQHMKVMWRQKSRLDQSLY